MAPAYPGCGRRVRSSGPCSVGSRPQGLQCRLSESSSVCCLGINSAFSPRATECVCVCVCVLVTQSCPTLCDSMDYSLPGPRLLCPWNFPGKNTGVGCHFLLHLCTVVWISEQVSHFQLLLPTHICAEGFSDSSVVKKPLVNAGDPSSIPMLGRCPGEGKGYPLQCSGLESSRDYTIHGVAKSQT